MARRLPNAGWAERKRWATKHWVAGFTAARRRAEVRVASPAIGEAPWEKEDEEGGGAGGLKPNAGCSCTRGTRGQRASGARIEGKKRRWRRNPDCVDPRPLAALCPCPCHQRPTPLHCSPPTNQPPTTASDNRPTTWQTVAHLSNAKQDNEREEHTHKLRLRHSQQKLQQPGLVTAVVFVMLLLPIQSM